jgi:hypothetical protein
VREENVSPGLQLREGEDAGIFLDAYSRLLSREGQQSAWTQKKTPSFFALWHSVTMESVSKGSRDKLSAETRHRRCTHGNGHRAEKPERKGRTPRNP